MLLQKLLKITLLGFIAFSPVSALADATIGKPAPAFSGTGADGSTVSLSALKGKTVVLEWTNHDCPYVKKHYESGNIPTLQKEAAAKGIVWLQVITSAPGTQGFIDGKTAIQINTYTKAAPANTLLDSDGKIGRAYGAQTTPHIFIINAEGLLVYKGGIDSIASTEKSDIAKAENYVKAAFSDLAAGKPVAKSSTKPYGCSVKYSS